ncbi:MAG: response regulator transcription factor, partial [Bradyrhizobium sp.]
MIAIIDDDKAVRDALQRMLRSHGFAATVFGSAEHFLTEAGPDQATCLIADVRMPGMTGLALHDHLMSRGLRLPT